MLYDGPARTALPMRCSVLLLLLLLLLRRHRAREAAHAFCP